MGKMYGICDLDDLILGDPTPHLDDAHLRTIPNCSQWGCGVKLTAESKIYVEIHRFYVFGELKPHYPS